MRGGITSGIVFPSAVAELAEEFDFRAIGETAAGAIAAALAAAAAYGRKVGRSTGPFQDLATMGKELADGSSGQSLMSMVQPRPGTRRIFSLLLAAKRGLGWGLLQAALLWVGHLFFFSLITGCLAVRLAAMAESFVKDTWHQGALRSRALRLERFAKARCRRGVRPVPGDQTAGTECTWRRRLARYEDPGARRPQT